MRLHRVLALTLVALALAAPATAGPKLSKLGTDPAGDGPPALDITYLEVGRVGKNLDVRIGVANMIPPSGGYPALPGIEWTFEVGTKTYIAEGVATPDGSGDFYLFQKKGASYAQLDAPTGTYKWDDGFIKILVPLKDIGARSGSVISGVGKKGNEDVDAHVHFGVMDYFADKMATTKDYVVP
jgi:hypothetical protein